MNIQKRSSRMRKGFTIVELILVIVVLGILAGVLYKSIPTLSGKSKEFEVSSLLRQAELAYNLAVSEVKYSLPHQKGDGKMNCFDFKGGLNMSGNNLGNVDEKAGDPAIGISTAGLELMYKEFDRIMRSFLIKEVGFKESTDPNAGIYLPGNPRNKIFLCGKGNARFIVIQNIKGDMGMNVLKSLNGGGQPSAFDSGRPDKRASLWSNNFATFKDGAFSDDFFTAALAGEADDDKSATNGQSRPFNAAAKPENKPATTLVYLLNPGSIDSGW